MQPNPKKFTGNSNEGSPLRIHELNIQDLALWLHEKKIRTTQGKIFQPLHDRHLDIINDPARFKVVAAGRRFGKTLITSLMALSVLFQMNRRIWIVAPDYSLCEKVFRELYNILVNQLKIIEPGKSGRARNQKGDYYLETPWGSVLEAKSMENPDSLAGEALDLVIVDEAALDPKLEDVWMQMIQPTLMDKKGSAVFISTPRGKNGFYKLFLYGELGSKQRLGKAPITKDPETGSPNDMTDWSSFKATSYDNPMLGSSPTESKIEIDAAYRRAVMSGKVEKFKQEYLADFESVADLCFPGFTVEATEKIKFPHVVDYKFHPDEGPIYAACDHNFAKPASTIFAQVNKYGDVIIFDEKFTKQTTSYMQAAQIMEKEEEVAKLGWAIWDKEKQLMKFRQRIKFKAVVADISGDQVQLNGRAAWDDFQSVLGYRPVGIKQGRETGCNLVRLWLNYPRFDEKGRPLVNKDTKEQQGYPKLFISSNCINLIYAVSTARFKSANSGSLKEDYEETPEGYEGLLDALRYLMVYLFHDKSSKVFISEGF